MRWHTTIIVAGCLAVLGCDEQSTPGGPPDLPVEDARVATESKLNALAGRWSGEIETEDFGRVSVRLFTTPEGTAQYQLRAELLSRSDTLQVTYFDGKELRAQIEAKEMSFHAVLEGDTLRITLPKVGPAILRRMPAREL